ncbi:uncharacterized protein F4822DRAFT_425728 [Hypoxylon trugodes]|uniref:uncharacterized protein n=1 Tax=Hypoxylon trugodes TaxID=326681 RepID=UPI002194EB1F|nr:uncharacterized protein F4822DRAFT_425728 [Hypoxylon trugodes]KAI1392523.1 hypothetical protein F4822DRAFT_425728 [Hypoxylon trugodes]
MSTFNCGHTLPKSRVGAKLSQIPGKRCPECQTRAVNGVLGLLTNMQKPENVRDPDVDEYLLTYIFDRFVSQRKSTAAGFRQRFKEVLGAWSQATYCLLDRKRISNCLDTARSRWGSDVATQALRALGATALKMCGIYSPIEPVAVDFVIPLNGMIDLLRTRATTVESFDQLEVIFDNAATLREAADDVIRAFARINDDFDRWNTTVKR